MTFITARTACRGARSVPVLLVGFATALGGCSSVEIVRHRNNLARPVHRNGTPVTVKTKCAGFYLATVGLPRCDADKVTNKLLLATARKLGARHVEELRVEGTPEKGWWWLTKLLWVRRARASAVVVIPHPEGPPPASSPASLPASSPISLPAD